MDTDSKTNSNVKVKKNSCKNEKKKKMETKDTDATLDEVCRQMSKLADEEESASSTDSEDLVNAINYNTITSLAALKDIIQGDKNDTPETDSFFHHYFMNHCNNLSNLNSASNSPFPFPERRRLSQCREEDEDDEKKESDPPPSIVSSGGVSEVASQVNLGSFTKDFINIDVNNDQPDNTKSDMLNDSIKDSEVDQDPSLKRTVMGAKHKFLVSPSSSNTIERVLRLQVNPAHTVHFGTKGAEEQRPSMRSIFTGQNLHRDKNYFDTSLIEIRSTVSSTSDDVFASSEDIWVKRTEDNHIVSISICH